MRRLTLSGTFLVLLAALYFLWQYRFERSPDFPTIRLPELRSFNSLPPDAEWLGPEAHPMLRLRVDQGHPRAVVHLDFPEMKAVDFLHLRYQVNAKNLEPGKEVWEDGRCMIEWHPRSGGSEWESDPFCSVRHDRTGNVMEWVMRPDQPPAIPALRFENLGIRGDLEIPLFEATVIRERVVWKIGRWILMAGWLAWVVAWIGMNGKNGLIRSLAAASVWLLMGLYFVVPGPWKCYRSFGTPFQIGGEITGIHDVSSRVSSPPILPRDSAPHGHPAPLKSVGKIPDKGDFTLRLKHYAANARPLLHIALLFGPALAIACLVGRKPARSLAVIFALATEAAQFSFGYGFDWLDISDLICDAAGIAFALAAHRYLQRTMSRMVARWLGSAIMEATLPLER